MAIDWTPARLEVDLNYKSKDIVLASEWNNLWKETRLQGNNNTDGIVLLIEIVEGNVTHLTNLDNLFSDLESKVTAHTGNTDIHVTSEQKTAWTAKYDKPSGGIPKTDLASPVQSSLDKADTALQQHQDISALTAHVANSNIHVTTDDKTAWNTKYDKPTDGIPKSDLASAVQISLSKADTALQEHQDISDLVSHTQNSNIHVTSEQKTAWTAKYDKPTGGIPKSDLASAVQTSLGKADTALQQHQDISGKADVTALTAHTGNTAIHTNATEKSAWNAKADVFTIALSDGANGSLTTDKTFSEILEAYNSGKLLRITAEGGMLEGVFLAYAYDTFSFVFITNSTGVYITSDAVGTAPVPAFLPSARSSDKGKILTVDNNGNAVWAEATSSGSSGSDVFLVTFTAVGLLKFTVDKTYAEIVAAHEAGKIVRCSISGSLFGQSLAFLNNTAFFIVEDYINAFSEIASTALFTINSADELTFKLFYHYTSEFSQKTINASKWSNGVYSFESAFPFEYFDIEIELDSTATESQLEAWSSAKPTAVFGTNTMKALGDVPTVDIPVIVKAVIK